MQRRMLLVCAVALAMVFAAPGFAQETVYDVSLNTTYTMIDSSTANDLDWTIAGPGVCGPPVYEALGIDPVNGGLIAAWNQAYGEINVGISNDDGQTWHIQYIVNDDASIAFPNRGWIRHVMPRSDFPYVSMTHSMYYESDTEANYFADYSQHLYGNYLGYGQAFWSNIGNSPHHTALETDQGFYRGPLIISSDDPAIVYSISEWQPGQDETYPNEMIAFMKSTTSGVAWSDLVGLVIADQDELAQGNGMPDYCYDVYRGTGNALRSYDGGHVLVNATVEADSAADANGHVTPMVFHSTDYGETWTKYMLPRDGAMGYADDGRFDYGSSFVSTGDLWMDGAGDIHMTTMLSDTLNKVPYGPYDGDSQRQIWDFKKTATGWTASMVHASKLNSLYQFDLTHGYAGTNSEGMTILSYVDRQDTVAGINAVGRYSEDDIHVRVSTNNGATWSPPNKVTDSHTARGEITASFYATDFLYGGWMQEAGSDDTADTTDDPTYDAIMMYKIGVEDFELVNVGDDRPVTIDKYKLGQNYPNPFNPTTTIAFTIPKAQKVTLKVYNIMGQEVATLINNEIRHGDIRVTWDASHVATGTYFYTLTAGEFRQTKKMTIIK